MLGILYSLFIMPIQVIVEITYSVMCRFLGNKGFALIGVSLVIQTLVLPLYKRSDALQEEERLKQESMAHWVNHIRKTFKGDERFMMLQTYYRQQNYKTYYSLKSSFSILLQVPFFLAAYNYLSHLEELRGVSFFFINDLGSPDKTFVIAGFAINLLPILMTLFNVISGFIYTKGFPIKAKLQVYGLAAIFLVLLYNSPAGLVLYWTMNNLYSLLKNVFMKILKHPLEDLCAVMLIGCGVLTAVFYNNGSLYTSKVVALLCIALVAIVPVVLKYIKKNDEKESKLSARINSIKIPTGFFFFEMVFLTALLGYLIPISVISTSASEFIVSYRNPLNVIYNNIFIYAGFFIVWFMIFYLLMKEKAKKIFSAVMFAVCGVALLNYMAFNKSQGMMSSLLVYTKGIHFSGQEIAINILAVVAVLAVLTVLALVLPKICKYATQILIISMIVLCVMNTNKANVNLNQYAESRKSIATNDCISLSKKGQNVVVIMLDRAISGYAPFIFDEDPEVAKQFAGFTYYPNTLSYAMVTNYGAPSIFGGYEYTPDAMNKRTDKLLVDKHNEALLLMPTIFGKLGYNVTVCDPPYAGYQWNPDLSIYEGVENTKAYVSDGAFIENQAEYLHIDNKKKQDTNFLYYSFMKIMPLPIQKEIYNRGAYLTPADSVATGEESLTEVSDVFLNWYTSLTSLEQMTKINNDNSNNLMLFQNSTTHEPTVLKTPEYIPADDVDPEAEVEKFNAAKKTHNGVTLQAGGPYSLSYYHVNMASYKALGEWFDYLRKNECYDNTRIIIVADHAWGGLNQFDYMQLKDGNELDVEVMPYNPILMIKDFNAKELTTSNEFMTNADVPTYAMKGLVNNPVNPFTGNAINTDAKKKPHYVTSSNNFDTEDNNGNVFDSTDGVWYEFNGNNIFDVNSWRLYKEYAPVSPN